MRCNHSHYFSAVTIIIYLSSCFQQKQGHQQYGNNPEVPRIKQAILATSSNAGTKYQNYQSKRRAPSVVAEIFGKSGPVVGNCLRIAAGPLNRESIRQTGVNQFWASFGAVFSQLWARCFLAHQFAETFTDSSQSPSRNQWRSKPFQMAPKVGLGPSVTHKIQRFIGERKENLV
jgi:hypothetical protein